ncbi:ribokinase [Aeromonas australiensis]|uniref:PfkB family carbohydrate kinase n=1 Tax=Aeromonas australiensis TaxID=1114880 RepID=UPI001F22283D|nr:PfkB family carbohydrate kinase [Aeromonas australiensis]MCF3097039.1 ribokinase [Aeromonas australiensis]
MSPPIPTMPVMVIGAAFGDLILEMNRLPVSGGDEVARESGRQIGGCAFNVARALARLGAPVINGITVGQGSWGTAVESAMAAESLPVQLRDPAHDNGWCLALVEPDGERTFITVEGCEQYWDTHALSRLLPTEAGWLYASGYELTGTQGAQLLAWLRQLPDHITPFIDPGPRISELGAEKIAALLGRGAIFSLNRQEAAVLLDAPATAATVASFCQQHRASLIVREDKDGALVGTPDRQCLRVHPVAITLCDTVGAGDAHGGGTLMGLASGLPLAEAVRLGNLVAAIVVSRPGADNPPTRAELVSHYLPAITAA